MKIIWTTSYRVSLRPLATAITLLPLLATAQVGSTHKPLMIEEVVVTAQKRTESMQDTPISIAAFSESMLEDIGAYNAADIGQYTPNVDIFQTMGSTNNITVNIRGMWTAEPALSIDPKTGIYLDGVYIARNAGAVFDIVDLERIEILRGPQGTLWGKNTTGGAMHIITARPSGEFGLKQLISVANDGYRRFLTTVDSPSVAGFSAKFSYMKKSYDGWATNINPAAERDLGSEDVEAYRVALQWYPTENLSVAYSYDRTNSEAVPQPFQVTAVGPGGDVNGIYDIATDDFIVAAPLAELRANLDQSRRKVFNLDYQGREHVDIAGHNLTLTWEHRNLELKSISAYREYDSDFLEGSDLDDGAWTGLSTNSGQMVSVPVFHTRNIKSQQQFSQEFQAVGTALQGKLDYVVGMFYFEEDGREDNPWDTTNYVPDQPYLLRGIPLGSWYTIDNQSKAIYGQATWHLNPQWALTLGGRYTEDKKAITLLREDPRLSSNHTASARWTQFTPSLTIGYEPNDDLSLYARAAVGYNAGVFNAGALNPNDPSDFSVFDIPADEEKITSYELGLKSTWFENRVRINGAVFYNDNKNLQVTDFIQGVRTTINSGKSVTRGMELELTALPMEGLVVDAGYGYVSTKYDGGEEVVLDNDEGRGTGRLGTAYSFPLGRFGNLTARLDATYTGKTYYLSSSPFAVGKSFWLANARVTLSDISLGNGSLRVSLWSKNLMDKEYHVHGNDFGMDEGFGFAGHVFGPPRSTGIDLTYEI